MARDASHPRSVLCFPPWLAGGSGIRPSITSIIFSKCLYILKKYMIRENKCFSLVWFLFWKIRLLLMVAGGILNSWCWTIEITILMQPKRYKIMFINFEFESKFEYFMYYGFRHIEGSFLLASLRLLSEVIELEIKLLCFEMPIYGHWILSCFLFNGTVFTNNLIIDLLTQNEEFQ